MKHLVKKRYNLTRPRLIRNPTNVQHDAATPTNCEVSSTRSAEKQLNFGDVGASGSSKDYSAQITLENNQSHGSKSDAFSSGTGSAEKQFRPTTSSYLNASNLIAAYTTSSISFCSDGVLVGNGMSPISDPERSEQLRLNKKLLAVLQRMERMQERINCLESKFQNMGECIKIPARTSTPEDVLQPSEAEPNVKEWHKNVNHTSRQHVIELLVRAVEPRSPTADDRIRVALENFARKFEKELFETANSEAEYANLASKKCCSLKQQLVECIEKRKALQLNVPSKQLKPNGFIAWMSPSLE